jgi:HK97 family phage major capsid protein
MDEDKIQFLTTKEFQEQFNTLRNQLLETISKTVNKGINPHPTEEEFQKTLKDKKELYTLFAKALIATARQDYTDESIVQYKAIVNSTGDAVKGGFLVPEEFSTEVDRLASVYGVIRANARIVNMEGDTLNWPKVVSGVSASWKDEMESTGETNPVFGQTIVTAKKLAAITAISNEMLEDAPMSVIEIVVELMAEAFAQKEDLAGLVGDGTGTYGDVTGIFQASGSEVRLNVLGAGKTSFSDLEYTDLVVTKNALPQNLRANAKWYMSGDIRTIIESMTDANGNPLIKVNEDVDYLFSKPIVESDVAPGSSDDGISTSFLAYGDMKKALMLGLKSDIAIKTTSEGTTATAGSMFDKDGTAIRATRREAIGLHLGKAMVVTQTAAA